MFKKGYVVKIIDIYGSKTATIQKITKVSKGIASIQDSSLKFDAETGEEHDPAFGDGLRCFLVNFDDGEVGRLGLK